MVKHSDTEASRIKNQSCPHEDLPHPSSPLVIITVNSLVYFLPDFFCLHTIPYNIGF